MIFILPLNAQWVLETELPWDDPSLIIDALSVVDSSVSWVIGYYEYSALGQLYIAKRNTNGWKEIKHHNLDTSIWNINCVLALDTTNAWVTTTRGKMLRTANGGYNWTIQFDLGLSGYFNGMKFSRKFPNIGYTFADAPNFTGIYVLKTTDFGNNWQQQFISIPGFVGLYNSISVIDSTHVWLGLNSQSGHTVKLIMTTNAGLNWSIINMNQDGPGPRNIQFSSNKLFGVCQLYYTPCPLFRSTNGGFSWNIGLFTSGPDQNIRWIEESSVIYFQNYGQIQRSTNNGTSVTNMTLPFVPGFDHQLWYMDAVKINDQSIYAMCITSRRKVITLVDTLRVLGIQQVSSEIPESFDLRQNYPNPFNPGTKIKFSIPLSGGVDGAIGGSVLAKLIVYDILGREIATLVNEQLSPGTYEIDWSAGNYPSGVYLYQLRADGNVIDTKRMVLLK